MIWWWNKDNNTDEEPGGSVIVVSGLPRSGTSLMMQMLEAGGVEPLTDGVRSRDDDNPRGYYELERVKQLPEGDTDWIEEAQGRAVKVVSALVRHLPEDQMYRVIFMERHLQEVLASQEKMLDNREERKKTDDEEMARVFRNHLVEVQQWLAGRPNFQCLEVNFNRLVTDPEPVVREVNEFLEAGLDVGKMVEVVDPDLYRNRTEEPISK